jgi:tetratricopeptide (TPR) repeat protein
VIEQLEYYRRKFRDDGQIDPARLLLLAQDDEAVFCGCAELRDLSAQIRQRLGSTCLIIGMPFLPYIELLLAGLPAQAGCAIPLDTETRTFLHDIPVVRKAELVSAGAEAVVERLRQRKGVIVEGVGLVAAGALTIEQAYVNFCSVLHATTVKVLLDLLREPLPDKALLAGLEPLWEQLRTPLPIRTEGLNSFDAQNSSQILAAIDVAGRRTVELGLVDSFFGNISVALDDAIYISQTGASLDRLPGCVDLVLNDDSSCVGLTASSELAAHRAIFSASAARTILHGHPRFSVILSLLCEEGCDTEDCWKDCDKVRELNGVPVVAGEVGAGGLARSLPPVIGRCRLALVYGHGLFATGEQDFAQPLSAMLHFENWCRAHYLRRFERRLGIKVGEKENGSLATEGSVNSVDTVIQLSEKAHRLFRRKEYPQARELYRQGLSAEADNPYLLSGMGDVCRKMGDFAGAQKVYQRLLQLEPENLFALRGLGDSFKGAGRLDEAIPHWVHYLRLQPADAHVMSRLADALKHLGRYAQAEGLYRQIIQLDSDDSYALRGLADLLQRTERYPESICCYERLLTLGHEVLHVLTIVGKLCWRLSDFEKAEYFFRKALDIDPENAYALYGLGNCYRWYRDYAQAVEIWQRLLLHNEGTATLFSRMGDAYVHLGDLASAEQAYRQVLDRGYDRFAKIGMVKLLCDQDEFSRAVYELEDLLANEADAWHQIEELSQRFVRTGRREALIRFYHHLRDAVLPDSIEPRRIRGILEKLEA